VSSILLSRMLYDVDPDFALDQYQRTRRAFVASHVGILPGVLEYPAGTSGHGDVDSGPLIFGLSGAATIVGIAAATVHGDSEFVDATASGGHALGFPVFGRYGLGLLPVGEAFFVWAKTTRSWTGPPPARKSWSRLMLTGWRFVWHLISLVLLAALFSSELRGAAQLARDGARG